jgi:hypothetical protein
MNAYDYVNGGVILSGPVFTLTNGTEGYICHGLAELCWIMDGMDGLCIVE